MFTIKELLLRAKEAQDWARDLLEAELASYNNSRGYSSDQMELELDSEGEVELVLDLTDAMFIDDIAEHQVRLKKLGIRSVRIHPPVDYYYPDNDE